MAFQPTTTKAGGDAAGDGDTKELSGGSKQKPCKALNKELLQLWANTKFCFLFGRLGDVWEEKSKTDFSHAMNRVNICCGLWRSEEQQTH